MMQKGGAKSSSEKMRKLRQENKAWKETCEILSDKKLLDSINISLKQIRSGKWIPLSKL